MKRSFRMLIRFVPFVVALGAGMASAAADAPELAMLDGLSKGSWDIRYRAGDAHTRICVRDARQLIQIRHEKAKCGRFVVEDEPSMVTVQYTCPGNGYGRTSIRRETQKLVQINSQGIDGGMPFNFQAEARWLGSC